MGFNNNNKKSDGTCNVNVAKRVRAVWFLPSNAHAHLTAIEEAVLGSHTGFPSRSNGRLPWRGNFGCGLIAPYQGTTPIITASCFGRVVLVTKAFWTETKTNKKSTLWQKNFSGRLFGTSILTKSHKWSSSLPEVTLLNISPPKRRASNIIFPNLQSSPKLDTTFIFLPSSIATFHPTFDTLLPQCF